MARVTTDEAGVQKLRELATNLERGYTEIETRSISLQDSFEERKDLLGPHTDQMDEIITCVDTGLASGNKSVDKVVSRLHCVAGAIEELIYKKIVGQSGLGAGTNLEVESFCTNIGGIRDTLSLGEGALGVKQLSGEHQDVKKQDGPGYESHHIPSAAVLKEFGIDPEGWPTIALLDEDHKDTDSYAGKQRRKGKSVFPDAPKSGTYKEESIKLVDAPGGLDQLIYDEILNIRKNHGDKYDGAIAKYLDEVEKYIRKNGIPKKPGKK